MKLLYGCDENVSEWVAQRIPHMPTGFKDAKAIGVVSNDQLIGAIVFHEYRVNDIQISVASISKRWLSKSILNAFFSYPFLQLGCDRVTSFIPKKNKQTREFVEGIGFKEEGNIRRGFLDDDCIVYGMLYEECKWIKDNHG